METKKIVEILKQIDINILLKQNTFKAVLADLLYDYEAERKILNTIHNSVNVIEKLHKSNNKILECQNIKTELLSYGLNSTTVEWAIEIWSGVLGINNVRNIEGTFNQFIKLSAGGSFTIALKDTKVYAWGNNKWGQLGNGTLFDCIRPVEISSNFNFNNNENIENIFTSFRSTYLLTTEGRLFSWGSNEYGQLGDGTIISKNYPINITSKFSLQNGEKILHFSTGGFHCLLITSFGRVFSWGNNEYGQLGDESNINKNLPVEITNKFSLVNNEKIENIKVGLGHSMVTTSMGRVYTWGNNEYGQLGDGTKTKRKKPTDVTRDFLFADNEKINFIALGALHSLVVTSSRVFTFGSNESGQLGDATTKMRYKPVDITNRFSPLPEEKIIKIEAGRNYSLALTSIGRVFSWGNNKFGQLGIADYITGTTGPMDITNNIINNDEELIVNIFTGANSTHSYAISNNDKIYAWGNNEYGQLGEGSTIEKRSPIEIKIG